MYANLSGLRVLVVEDDVLCAMLIADVLADLGCEVIGPASTVDEALAIVHRQDVDIAMLDLNLGRRETSYPIADALLARHVPFAFLTGLAAPELPPPYENWAFCRKPFRVDQFDSVIQHLATQRRPAA